MSTIHTGLMMLDFLPIQPEHDIQAETILVLNMPVKSLLVMAGFSGETDSWDDPTFTSWAKVRQIRPDVQSLAREPETLQNVLDADQREMNCRLGRKGI